MNRPFCKPCAAGKPRAAATDVASIEPITSGNPLLQAPNLLITPHMAWATLEARKRLMQMTAENVQSLYGRRADQRGELVEGFLIKRHHSNAGSHYA